MDTNQVWFESNGANNRLGRDSIAVGSSRPNVDANVTRSQRHKQSGGCWLMRHNPLTCHTRIGTCVVLSELRLLYATQNSV